MFIKVSNLLWGRVSRLLSAPNVHYIKTHNMLSQTSHPTIIDHIDYGCHPGNYMFIVTDPMPERMLVYDDICPNCLDYTFKINKREGVEFCPRCGYVKQSFDDVNYNHVPDYTRSVCSDRNKHVLPRKYSDQTYKRTNHFRYWINRLQGKEYNKPSIGTLEKIESEIRRLNGGIIPSNLCYDQVQDILREMKYQRYYHNIYSIISYIYGRPIIKFTAKHEELLIKRFYEIQLVYKNRPHDRCNMLFYPYVIRKLCELMGWVGLSRQIPLFKSRERLINADKIWRMVCSDLKWPFIKSVT
jgi:hypothetical protein